MARNVSQRRNHLRIHPIALLVLFLAVAILLLYIALHFAASHTFDIGVAGDTRFSTGFFPPEVGEGASFRWSGTDSELVLHGSGSGPHVLDVRLHGGQLGASGSNHLSLERSGRQVAALDVQPGWHEYHVLLPPEALSATFGEAPRLHLVSAVFPIATDNRKVGVALDWVRISSVDGSAFQDTAALWRALYLTWVLAVLAGLVWHGDRLVFRARERSRPWRVLLAVAAVAAALLWWAKHDPYLLAWLLPAIPWTVGLATFGLGISAYKHGIVRSVAHAHVPGSAAPARKTIWIGLATLAVAQCLLNAQYALPLGIVVALAGLALIERASVTGTSIASVPWAVPDVSSGITSRSEPGRRGAGILLALIVLVALMLRFYRINDLPYGLWRDEARHGLVALQMIEQPGYRPVYVPEVDLPGLGLYPFALALKVWGLHPWSMRPSTAMAGALTALPLYGFAYRLMGRRSLALLSAALLMVSGWNLTISRLSFPHIFDPLLTLTGLWLVLVGFQGAERRSGRQNHKTSGSSWLVFLGSMLLAGFCLGLALHTYHTGRLAPLFAALLALCWLLGQPRQWRRWLVGGLLLAVGYLGATWPLLHYAIQQPEVFNGRMNEVGVLSEKALRGRAPLAVLDEAVARHLLMFNVHGDTNGRHNAPGRPMLDWVTGFGFLVGVATLLRLWRDWRSLFLLGALVLGLLPSMLAVDAPHALRSFDAAAFAIMIAALGWIEIWRLTMAQSGIRAPGMARPRFGVPRSVLGGSLIVLLALGLNAWSYFVASPGNPGVWQAFYPIQTQIGAYLRHVAEEQGAQELQHVYLKKSIVDNTVTAYLLHGLQVQTFDGTKFSSTPQRDALFVLSGYSYQQDVVTLAPYLGPAPAPILIGPLLPDGTTPSFVVYTRR